MTSIVLGSGHGIVMAGNCKGLLTNLRRSPRFVGHDHPSNLSGAEGAKADSAHLASPSFPFLRLCSHAVFRHAP